METLFQLLTAVLGVFNCFQLDFRHLFRAIDKSKANICIITRDWCNDSRLKYIVGIL